MELLADLTPAQREAVTHVEGPLLVLAGAGSGKTRVITRRVAYLLKRGISGQRILALTFTNKAAGEMRTRIDTLAPGSGVWVGTFHGLCARLLRTYAPLVGLDRNFTIYDQADRLRAIKDVIDQQGLETVGVTAERIEAIISRAKNDLLGPDGLAARASFDHAAAVAVPIYRAYQQRLRASSAVDFDDLLLHVVSILKNHPDLRGELDRKYAYILVDEYQDTNLAQYAIVRGLSTIEPNVCVTGDPDQSIYGWRGANLANILEFEADYPGCRVVTLERNYRSTKQILRAADHLIRHNRRRKPKALVTENPEGAPVELAVFATEADEAQAVASKVVELVRDGEYGFRDVAVFVRVTALTRAFENAFRQAKIPYQVVGGVSFYERQEIKDVLAYLNLIANPKDDLAFLRAVQAPPRGIGPTTLNRLVDRARSLDLPLAAMAREAQSVPGVKDKPARALRDFAMLLDELAALRDHPAEVVLRKLLTLSGYHEHLAGDAQGSGEDRLANLEELVSAARQFDREHPGASILDFLEEISLATAVDRWNDDGGSVTLMTLHAAKGLEFPVVFIVGLEQGLLPHARANENDEEQEEERRLLFVGITRAQKELYLSHCRIREFRGSRSATVPSCFLDELPSEALRVRDLSGFGGLTTSAGPARRFERSSRPAGWFHLTTAAELARGPAAAGTPTTGDPLDAFRPGVKVIHPEYGLGKVVAIDGAGPNRKGRIAFVLGGERTFVLAKSPLRTVG